MNINELCNKAEKTNSSRFFDFFEECIEEVSLKNIKKRDMDKIIESWGPGVFHWSEFTEIYKMKISDNTNIVMKSWTIAIGIMTMLMTLVTIVNNYETIVTFLKQL